ncbi:hypothetical protein [Escherichia phage ST20]|nr:hypothetical protein [Escherichia phage ST20]
MNNVTIGGIYKSDYSWDGEGNARFIVTAVGLDHVLIADHPLIKFNESYLEYCVGRKEFEAKFKFAGEKK